MNHDTPAVTPLRQRMIEDMRMRKLSDKTQHAYIRAVRKLAAFISRSPDTATVEDLRRFQLHLVDQGTSPITLNATLTGLKFFFEITLDQAELMAKMQPVRVPQTLPVVLSREEVARLIAAARNLKHQTALSVAYGAGLRASEVIALIYGLLFEIAAQALHTIAADPKHLGARIGTTLVMHTWGSALTHHPHVHGIVAPAAPRRYNRVPSVASL